jgi:UDP-glucose 4-epimerase
VSDVVPVTDRVLVTGAGGFVGRHLVDRLTNDGLKIVATDIEPEPPARFDDAVGDAVEYRTGDLIDDAFRESLLDRKYDRIYHFAAIVGVNEYVRNPLRIVETNVEVTRKLLDAIKEWDVRFVFTSTSEVYGKNPDVPWSETDDQVVGAPTTDRWSYSTTKTMCEHMIHGLARTDCALDATVVRPFNLYGPEQRPDFVIPAFVEAVVNGEVPTVYDDGTQTRCFTYIDDFVEGVERAARRPEGVNEVFNLGHTRETSIAELAETVLSIVGWDDKEPTFVDPKEVYGNGYEDLDRRIPDVSKANAQLDWTAETDLRTGLERTIEWERENY